MIIFIGVDLVTIPEAARTLRRSPQGLQLFCFLVGAGLAAVAQEWKPSCWWRSRRAVCTRSAMYRRASPVPVPPAVRAIDGPQSDQPDDYRPSA